MSNTPTIIHLDYETRSRVDISSAGAFRYAQDDSTEIFCAGIAVDDGPVRMWVNPKWRDVAKHELGDGMGFASSEVWAHNAQFEFAITQHQGEQHNFWIEPKQWRCTAALCRRANIPASLEKAGAALGLTQQKDTRGKALIRKFSIPNPKTGQFTEPEEDPEAFRQFIEYCRQDVVVEQQIHKELSAFKLVGPVLDTFLVDLRINARGLEVNVDALRHVQRLIEVQEEELRNEFRERFGFNPTQRDVFLKWLKEQGYKGDGLKAADMEEEFSSDDFDPQSDLGIALTIRKKLSFASIKKVKSMLECVCSDGAVRGTLQYHGAATGRWSGRLIQPQNFKRPTIKHTARAYEDICNHESTVHIELCNGPLMEVAASCIRHFIQPKQGVLLDCDYSSIEARGVNWLAGQEHALKEYRLGIDRYKSMASVIYHVPVEEVNDFPQRFVGKQATLGCGYQMSGPKFRITCANYGYDLPWEVDVIEKTSKTTLATGISRDAAKKMVSKLRAEAKLVGKKLKYRIVTFEDKVVRAFRESHPDLVKFWYACEKAAIAAVKNPGVKYDVGKVTFFCADTAGARYLFIKLPSGRRLAYRDPQLKQVPVQPDEDDDVEEEPRYKTALCYWGQIPGKANYGHVYLYGGKIVENITQAVAADLMSAAAVLAEKSGIEIATLVHDQCLAYCRDAAQAQEKLKLLEKCMTTLPAWADGLPVAVDGKITPYYKK